MLTSPRRTPAPVRRPKRRRTLAAGMLALLTTTLVGASPVQGDAAPASGATIAATPAPLDYAWSGVKIGGGGYVTGLVTGPTGEVYARTDVGGAYRWDEASKTWSQIITAPGVPDGHPDRDYQVESIAVAPSNGKVVYVAVGNSLSTRAGRILRSSDGGRTWRDGGQRFVIAGNEPWRWSGERLSVDPANPDVVLFGTRHEGLWRSADGGTTWSQTSLPFPATAPKEAAAGVMFTIFQPGGTGGRTRTAWAGVQGAGVYRTDDAGVTWRVVHGITGGVPRDAEFGPDGNLYVVVHASPSQVVRIVPSTSAVTAITPPTRANLATIAVDPHQAGRLIVGETGVRDGHLWRSTNAGASWTKLNINLAKGTWPATTDIEGWMSAGELTFDRARPGRLWFAEGMGVWSTTDLADTNVTWQFTSNGIEELVSNDAVKPSGRPLLTAHWDRNIFRHPGTTPAATALNGRFNSAWDLDVADHDPSFVVAVVDDHRFCCEADGQHRQSGFSTDGGTTWQRFASIEAGTHPAGLAFGNIAVSTGDSNNLVWLPSRGGQVHFTRDRGRTWQAAAFPGTQPHAGFHLSRRVLVADPVTRGTFYLLDAKGLLRSTDGGATWTKTAGTGMAPGWALPYNATVVAVPGRAKELLVALGPQNGASFGVFRTTNGGDSWTELPGLTDAGTVDVGPALAAGKPGTIFANGTVGGTYGVWRSEDVGTTWRLTSAAPKGVYQRIRVLTADPDVPGKVYVGFAGHGFMAGEPKLTATTPPAGVDATTTTTVATTTVTTTTTTAAPAAGGSTTLAHRAGVVGPQGAVTVDVATGKPAALTTSAPDPRRLVAVAERLDGDGTWAADAAGNMYTTGRVANHGGVGHLPLNAPVMGMTPTASGDGYWMVASDGGIFAFGDATFLGSMGGTRLNQPITGMAVTPSGNGYYLVASDGGIFSFGDAGFHGSTGGIRLNRPINGMAVTPTGRGYWMVADDGGVFAFGDAGFHGSLGGQPLSSPIVGMVAAGTGEGYWLVDATGRATAFGRTA